eukprot:TRINITY_DN4237_c0_g1_i1.p1 TRINITY_DN4237_c0_g1~~TRINITY_DN4237_c0_g1_i1.p1  ORF type:complete len:634 (-),score=179.24 TRINITY_DN4237_c0_g1_i1:165-2066(-)
MDLAEMRRWLVEEMEYPGSLPSEENLQELCTGAMRDVWKHLIGHCKSQEKAKIIRGNLAIAARKHNSAKSSFSVTTSTNGGISGTGDDGGERDELLAERSRLTSQLHATVAKIDRLKTDIRSAEEYKLTTLQTQTEKEDQIRRLRQSYTLLNLYRKQVEGVVGKINALTARVTACSELVKQKQNCAKSEATLVTAVSGGEVVVQTQADKQVKEALEKISGHMQAALLNTNNSASRKAMREELQSSLSNLSGASVQKALNKTIQSQIDRLTHQLQNFDLKQEAEALRHEESESGAVVSFVRDEVDSLTKKFINSHQQLLAARKSVAEHEQQLEDMYKDNLENILDTAEVKNSVKRSYEAALAEAKNKEITKLEKLLQDLEQNEEQVITWTRNSEANIQEIVNLISLLIESKVSGQKKLLQRKNATEELVKGLPKAGASLLATIEKSKGEPEDMMKTFLQVPVSRYTSTAVQEKSGCSLVPTQDLSIKRLSKNTQYPDKKNLHPDQFGLTNSKHSVPDLSNKVYNLLGDIEQLKEEKERSKSKSDEMRLLESIQQLPVSLQTSKAQQEKDFLPLVSSTGKKCEEGVQLCADVESALADYDTQYTQVIVGQDTDLQVEGRNLAQWQEALRVAILNT